MSDHIKLLFARIIICDVTDLRYIQAVSEIYYCTYVLLVLLYTNLFLVVEYLFTNRHLLWLRFYRARIVHYRVNKSTLFGRVLRHFIPVHMLAFCLTSFFVLLFEFILKFLVKVRNANSRK